MRLILKLENLFYLQASLSKVLCRIIIKPQIFKKSFFIFDSLSSCRAIYKIMLSFKRGSFPVVAVKKLYRVVKLFQVLEMFGFDSLIFMFFVGFFVVAVGFFGGLFLFVWFGLFLWFWGVFFVCF